jgi:predicted metal-binding membrane protein
MQSAFPYFPRFRRPGLLLVWGAIVAAWIVTLALVATGGGEYIVDHDAVLAEPRFAWPLTVFLFLASWQLMTAAMMLPSSLPMIAAFLRVSRNDSHPRLAFGRFLLGYFAIWTGFAIAALAGDAGVHWLVDHVPAVAERQWLIGGAILVLAGAFQFSSLKERCLDACREPITFLWTHYIARTRSAWWLGLRHGIFCLGCCWALMLTMFAVGMGSLVWMTALAGVMLIEKTSRYGNRLARPIGAFLIAWGVLVMLNVEWLPALVQGA